MAGGTPQLEGGAGAPHAHGRPGHRPAPGAPQTGTAARGPGPSDPADDPAVTKPLEAWLARLGVFIVAIVLFRLGFELWWIGRIHENPFVQFCVVLFYLGGLAFLFLAFMRIPHERLHLIGFSYLMVCLSLYAVVSLTVVNLRYTSDAMLFVHEAAAAFVAGQNPYTVDLVGGYEQFDVPYYVSTPTTTGGTVTNLNYPALSFLIYAPFVALGVPDLRPISLAFLLALLVLFYLAVPKALRLLVVSVLFLSSFFIAFSLSGFDIVFIYFLIASAAFWERHKGWSAFFYGLACATKQTVWFMAPFYLAALWNDQADLPVRDRAHAVLRQVGIVSVVFLLPNLPFLLWDPKAWFVGVFTPFGLSGETLVPLSQGITVPFYTGLFDFDPFLLHLLAGVVLLVLLLAYWRYYARLKPLMWMVPPFVLAFTERSLQNYFEMFYPVGLFLLVRHAPFVDQVTGPFATKPDPDDTWRTESGRSIIAPGANRYRHPARGGPVHHQATGTYRARHASERPVGDPPPGGGAP